MKFCLSYLRAHGPAFIAQRRKTVAAFVAPIVVAQMARIAPGVHVDVSIVDQLIAAALSAFAVHQVPNIAKTVAPPAP